MLASESRLSGPPVYREDGNQGRWSRVGFVARREWIVEVIAMSVV